MRREPTEDPLGGLVDRAQRGDAEAFSALYEALYPRVWAFVARRRRGRADVEDLVSKTFHRFLAKLDSFDARRGRVHVFVLAIARHALVDEARAQRPSVPVNEATLLELDTPLSNLLRDEELRALKREVEQLPAADRELLVLRFGDGLRYNDIAQLLCAQEDAIKKRFSRLLGLLRERMAAAMRELPT